MVLKVDNLSIGYDKPLLEGISFEVKEKQILHILGDNGIGKSTLIKTLISSLRPKAGSFEWSVLKSNISTLPQSSNTSAHFPILVREFLSLYDIVEDFEKLIDKSLLNKSFYELSGGQRKKVLILSRLAKNIKVLILDEPFNHLDKKNRKEVQEFLAHLVEEGHLKAILFISHQELEVEIDNYKRLEL